MVAAAALPLLATTKHSTQILPYYLISLLPAAMTLAGLALAAIPWKLVAAAVLAAPLLFELSSYVQLQQGVIENGPRLNYGMPLRYEALAAEQLQAPPGGRLFVGQQGNQR